MCDENRGLCGRSSPQTPEWLSETVARLLAKNPDDRFQSAAEVAELLNRHLTEAHDAPVARRKSTLPAARALETAGGCGYGAAGVAVGLGLGVYEIVIRIHGKDGETVVRVEEGSEVAVHGNQVNITPPQAASANQPATDASKTPRRFNISDKPITKDGISVDGNASRIEAKDSRVCAAL